MADSYPYMTSNNKISQILDKIRKAAEPPKFTHSFLVKLGFASTNDRGIIPLLKKLDFLNEDGTPTSYYKELRDGTRYRYVLGEKVRELYSDIYSINTEMHQESEEVVKGAISRVTGKDEKSVHRYYSTYRTLVDIAEFNTNEPEEEEVEENEVEDKAEGESKVKPKDQKLTGEIPFQQNVLKAPQFHYNIQIHLPATTDISVYNAIFKSIKENLMQ